MDGWNLDQKLAVASDALCLPPDDRQVGTLSGGERRRVALCKVLLEQPDLLLLDEPTNHLDAETVNWLEEQLRVYPGTVIVVTHDRYFLDNVTGWILELEGGHGIPWQGNYSSWLEQKLAKLAAGEKGDSTRGRALRRELDWIRMSRGDRNAQSKSRLREYEQLVARERAEQRGEAEAAIRIAPGPELGGQVLDFKDVAFGYAERPLFAQLSFSVPRGAVIGLVGPNGAGKTSLFKLIAGTLAPQAGSVSLGAAVKLVHGDQERSGLAADRTLIEEVGDGAEEIVIGSQKIPVRKYLAQFGFKGASQQKRTSEFSGGERNRCHLAKLLKVGGNLILLDEPTNDLDVNTLRLLEEAILDFSGCVLAISHDRFFLDRVCTHTLVFEGEGRVRFWEGNFSSYEDWRQKELGDRLFENRRNRYRTSGEGLAPPFRAEVCQEHRTGRGGPVRAGSGVSRNAETFPHGLSYSICYSGVRRALADSARGERGRPCRCIGFRGQSRSWPRSPPSPWFFKCRVRRQRRVAPVAAPVRERDSPSSGAGRRGPARPSPSRVRWSCSPTERC